MGDKRVTKQAEANWQQSGPSHFFLHCPCILKIIVILENKHDFWLMKFFPGISISRH